MGRVGGAGGGKRARMEIKPFRGYRYDVAVVGDTGACVAPPYDVIDQADQRRLYSRSPYNIVRVDKGLPEADDNERENVYTRAGGVLREFIRTGALKRDPVETVYAYVQDFELGGVRRRRSGFVALGKLEPYGGSILPHEQTLSGPKADRLKLLRATHSQIGQVFLLYDDPARTIDGLLAEAAQGKELVRHVDESGVVHRLYAITRSKAVETIRQTLRDKTGFIADGHHRYETALAYGQETRQDAAGWQMMTFVNTYNEGLAVLPTHRLIHGVAGFDCTQLLGRLHEQFDVVRLGFADEMGKRGREEELFDRLRLERERGQHAVGMYFADGAFYVATLREEAAMDAAAGDHGAAWRRLDVAILHRLVLEKLLGIDAAALAAERHVEYIKDLGEARGRAIAKVDAGEGQAVFFLNPTPPAEVEAVARAGERMPQKSTFFYPKVFSGLVVHVLDEVEQAPAQGVRAAAVRASEQ